MPSPFDLGKSSGRTGSPFDLEKSKGSSSPFDMTGSKRSSPFDMKSPSAASMSESLPVLEQQAAAVGSPDVPQDSPGLFRSVLDVISRPNYAVAGAAEELFSRQGGGLGAVPGRVASELFSGIGNLKGQKEGFGQVMEQAGVGEMGHFSDLAGVMFNETGEGWQLQRGGWADPTGRGAIGLGLDIAADPTTYLGVGIGGKTAKVGGKFLSKEGQRVFTEGAIKATEDLGVRAAAIKSAKALDPTVTSMAANAALGRGTEAAPLLRELAIKKSKELVQAAIDGGATDLLDKGGIKWAGIHIADNPLSAVANSGMAKDLAEKIAGTKAGSAVFSSVSWMKKNLTDPVANLFVKGYGIKGLEGAQPIIDDALNKKGWYQSLMHEDIAKSPFLPWLKMSSKKRAAIFQPVIDAFQIGGVAAVPDEFKPAMEYYAKSVAKMYDQEVASGLLGREQKLAYYFAQYYHNEPEDLARVIYKQHGGTSSQGTVENMLRLGRNAEERVYPTLRDASENSTRLNRADKSVPILKPVYDPVDSLTRRWDHSITKRVNREMVSSLSAKFPQLPFDVNAVYDLAKPVKYGVVPAKDFTAIQKLLTSDSRAIDKVAEVSKMSDAGKANFFAARFRQIGDRAEASNVLARYDQFREFFPKEINPYSDFAADGSRFVELNVGSYKATLPESLAKEVGGLNDSLLKNPNLRKLLQGYDTVNNVWKGSVTWLFPAFHARNAYSNVAQAFVDIGVGALDPASYKTTAEILFTKNPGVFKTATGSYTFDEVRTILNRHGVNTSPSALAEFTGAGRSPLLKPFSKAREFGTAIENESRAQLALNYLLRGMDPAEVGARVKKFELDYANGLTNFERTWMKRVIPFYTFQRLNLGLQVDNLLKRPGMTLAQVKPFRGREDENAQMTSWDAGALKIRLNRDGKNVQMITGIDLPIRNLDLLFRGTLRETFANGIGMLTPFLKVPIEVGANKSFFTGNEFDRKNAHTAGVIVEQMPKAVQQWMGYKKVPDAAGRPQYTFDAQRYYLLAESFVTSRILSTSDRQWRQYLSTADGNSIQSLLDITTGLRWQNMDMTEEMKKREAERKKDLERALVRWGERKTFTKTFQQKGQQ